MFEKLLKIFGFKRVLVDLEANLFSVDEPTRKIGEFEYKKTDDGITKLELELGFDSTVPKGTALFVKSGDQLIYQTEYKGTKIDICDRMDSSDVVDLIEGVEICVTDNKNVLAKGVLEPD